MMALLSRLALASALFAGLPAAASAGPVATARLVACDAGNCLLVRGHRGSAASRVWINDRPVAPTGKHDWSVRVPMATLRDWSAPFARTIAVAVIDPAGAVEDSDTVRLPVGLLGHDVERALLVVRAR